MESIINYEDVLKLGFKREQQSDSVFYNQHGWYDFYMVLKINSTLYFDWDCETRKVTLIRTDKSQTILAKLPIQSYKHLVEMLQFYGKAKNNDESFCYFA